MEMRSLLHSPITAVNALCDLLREERKSPNSDEQTQEVTARVIIDADGNVTLNFKNPQVREEFAHHVQMLSSSADSKRADK